MKAEDKRVIKEEIAPRVQTGDMTLILGAGYSHGVPSKAGGIPSTQELIERICKATEKPELAGKISLPDAFSYGERNIDDFEKFLLENFKCSDVLEWQKKIFEFWWRAVFTTNIDDVPESAIETIGNSPDYPGYKVFNYKDREPVNPLITEPPVVHIHGYVRRLNEGLVFDNVQYADFSNSEPDWLRRCGLHIHHGGCLFVGSKFNESDIEASIRKRQYFDDNDQSLNWIVLKTVDDIAKDNFESRGIQPIEATADEFFRELFANLSYVSPRKFMKQKAPYLDENDRTAASAWFYQNFSNIGLELRKAREAKGVESFFYEGDVPDWYYVANRVPAYLSFAQEIEDEIHKFIGSEGKTKLISVVGQVGSGKTTACMMGLSKIAEIEPNTYWHSGIDGIDIEHVWSIIKDAKGVFIITVDAASEHFYAINEILKRANRERIGSRVCIVIEERTFWYERNFRHLIDVEEDAFVQIDVPRLSEQDAKNLLESASSVGVSFAKLHGMSNDAAISKLVSVEHGYKGDLLATMHDLSSNKALNEKLLSEYEEIVDEDAKQVYVTISLLSADRLYVPVSYLSEVHKIGIPRIMEILRLALKGKIYYDRYNEAVVSRGHSISEFQIRNIFRKDDIKNSVIGLLRCVAPKFKIEDIRRHPISYRIYKSIVSYRYLSTMLFPGKKNRETIHQIYSEAQRYFSRDGVFWLQYGRFLEQIGNLDQAIHCFRKGLDLYQGSFQIAHALGQVLIKRFVLNGLNDPVDLEEGIRVLDAEIKRRGNFDPFPYCALIAGLLEVIDNGYEVEEHSKIAKEYANEAIKYHKRDQHVIELFTRVSQI